MAKDVAFEILKLAEATKAAEQQSMLSRCSYTLQLISPGSKNPFAAMQLGFDGTGMVHARLRKTTRANEFLDLMVVPAESGLEFLVDCLLKQDWRQRSNGGYRAMLDLEDADKRASYRLGWAERIDVVLRRRHCSGQDGSPMFVRHLRVTSIAGLKEALLALAKFVQALQPACTC